MSRSSMHPAAVEQAAHNNAVWCDTISRVHGRLGQFHESIWVNPLPMPRVYPNAVTLAAATAAPAQLREVSALIDAGLPSEWGVKDSFCGLDLSQLGFRVLFEAQWIHRSASPLRVSDDATHWSRISSASELAAWEIAWGATGDEPRIFLPALLDDPNVAILAGRREDRIVAGGIANRSGAVVGISNLFTAGHAADRVRSGCLAAVSEVFPGLAMVGYESGADIEAMSALGFEPIGALRVWVRRRVTIVD